MVPTVVTAMTIAFVLFQELSSLRILRVIVLQDVIQLYQTVASSSVKYENHTIRRSNRCPMVAQNL